MVLLVKVYVQNWEMVDYSTKGVAASGNILGKNVYSYLVLYTTINSNDYVFTLENVHKNNSKRK